MPTIPPTARQKQVLRFIEATIETRGYPPSLREIAHHFQMSGTRGVERHIEALEKKGHLRKGAGARALSLVRQSQGRSIPVIGQVAAGQPILAEENISDTLTLDSSIARWENCFLLKVKGQSMKDAGILEGDLVLVKPQASADSEDIVVAISEGEGTVKRLLRRDGETLLMPENAAYKPIRIGKHGNFEIVGKVVGVLRI